MYERKPDHPILCMFLYGMMALIVRELFTTTPRSPLRRLRVLSDWVSALPSPTRSVPLCRLQLSLNAEMIPQHPTPSLSRKLRNFRSHHAKLVLSSCLRTKLGSLCLNTIYRVCKPGVWSRDQLGRVSHLLATVSVTACQYMYACMCMCIHARL